MPLDVYQDDEAEANEPLRKRSVSFAAGSRAPLTPHAAKTNLLRSKTARKSSTETQHMMGDDDRRDHHGQKLKDRAAAPSTMTTENHSGKENEQSVVMSSLRRQLRATMSPTPAAADAVAAAMKENQNRTSTSTTSTTTSARASTTRRPKALTPSLRHNKRQGSKQQHPKLLKTPKSLLKGELDFNEAEESLLLSPAAAVTFSLADPSPPLSQASRRRHIPKLTPAIEDLESGENRESEVEEEKTTEDSGVNATVGQKDAEPIVEQKATNDEPLPPRTTKNEKADASNRKGHTANRTISRQQKQRKVQQPSVMTDTKMMTGTTPYRTRGNGVQMDLSSMFSEVASSPPPQGHPRGKSSVETKQEVQSAGNSVLNEVPVVSLHNLGESLWLDFGDDQTNRVGETMVLSFAIEAPAGHDCVAQVERVPFKKGFDLIVNEESMIDVDITSNAKPTSIRVRGGERVLIDVSWTPTEPGGVREVIYLKLARGRLCVVVHGKARRDKKAANGVVRKTERPIAQKLKKAPAIIPTTEQNSAITPNGKSQPFRVFAKSSPGSSITNAEQAKAPRFFDEKWADKQCEAFANWMNYTFQPSEDKDHEATLLGDGDATAISDRGALRTLILHRRMAQVRARATDLFKGEKMTIASRAILAEVSKRRLKLREDRDMYADLTLRGQITSLLMSYTTPWLRLGLETIFGETISPESPNHFSPQKAGLAGLTRKTEKVPLSRMKMTLKGFIVNRVLSDPATLAKYTKGKCNVPSGSFEKKFKAEMRFLTLRRLLILIVFLDRAKEANILDRVPMMFAKTSKVKSTREVLIRLCRDFLSSEGDILKHLSRIGITVSYKQAPIDEVDYTVKNLAVDLRDGVRLGRMTEILMCLEPKSILVKLRLPAISRLQKLHNVGSVLDVLRDHGIPSLNDLAPHHIVDAHREMVLKLMWSVLAHCALPSILDADAIENEIQSVLRANSARRPRWNLGVVSDLSVQHNCPVDVTSMGQEAFYKSLLLRWCNAVCFCFGRTVANFASSFADGTVLCLLIHYYHPGHLPLDRILSTTRHLRTDESGNHAIRAGALFRESANFELAQETISELGGIPRMITAANSDNPPEENSLFLSIAYLCSRLMESSNEILAAIRIQTSYSRYKRRVELEKKLVAASFILSSWRANKDRYFSHQERIFKQAVLVIERFLISVKPQLSEMRRKRLRNELRAIAATSIQAYARRMICERSVLPVMERTRAATKIQSIWRCYDATIEVQLRFIEQEAVVAIQAIWRGFQQRGLYALRMKSIIRIQAITRGCLTRNEFILRDQSAISIQRIWRGFWDQLQTQLDILDVIAVQSIVRRKLAVIEIDYRRRCILVLQRTVRRILSLRKATRLRNEREELARRTFASITCQTAARRFLAVRCFQHELRREIAARAIQSKLRGMRARREFQELKRASIVLQSSFRGARVREALFILNKSAVVIARTWRCFTTRARFMTEMKSVILVQATFRSWKARLQLTSLCLAATKIQARWRGFSAFSAFRQKMNLAIVIQRIYRGLVVRRELQFLDACSCAIQATWRCYWARLQYQLDLVEIIIAQSAIRRRKAIVVLKRRKTAVLKIQSFFRLCNAREQLVCLRQEDEERKRQEAACIALQNIMRRHLAIKSRRKQTQSITVCQSVARRHLARTRLKLEAASAIAIQSIWRAFTAYVEYHMTRSDVILIQTLLRSKLAVAEMDRRRNAVICIQCLSRRLIASRQAEVLCRQRQVKIREETLRRARATTYIQALFRGRTVRYKLQILTANAVTIQSAFRAFYQRLEYHMQLVDIILVQSAVRRWSARNQYNVAKDSALRIQTYLRVCLAKQETQRLRNTQEVATREHQAAAMIQKTWRCFTIHVDYMLLILSAISIQAMVRRHQAVLTCEMLHRGIVALQSLARGGYIRRRQRSFEMCATMIQSRVRGFIYESRFQSAVAAAVAIQRLSRGFLARVDIDLKNFAACEIQRIWRGYEQNVDFLLQLIAVITIQCAFRSALGKKELQIIRRQRFLEGIETRFREKKAVVIQRAFRMYIHLKFAANAAAILQAAARGFLCRLKMGRLLDCVISLQSRWRGRSTRRRRPKNTRAIAKRVAQANLRATKDPSMRLGVRTASALLVLQNSTRLAEIMNAVSTLETSTRLSMNCCIAFTECNAPEIVYSLIRTCNRSLPHVELVHYVLLTLANIANHDELLWRVATEESAEVYMDLVQMFRDKDNVFCLAVNLLYKSIAKNHDLRNLCATSENIKRLKGIHGICERKLSVSSTRVTRSVSAELKRQSTGGAIRKVDRRHGMYKLQKIVRVLEE